MYTIYLCNEEELQKVIDNPKENKGLFLSICDGYVVAVDNTTIHCDAFTEEFTSCENALLWLIDSKKEI